MQKRGPWKPQPTLNPYNGWVVARLMQAKNEGSGPVAEWIIDDWIKEHAKLLADQYDIRREQFADQLETMRKLFEKK